MITVTSRKKLSPGKQSAISKGPKGLKEAGGKSAVARTSGKYGPMIRDALKEMEEIDYNTLKEFCAKHDEKYPWVKSNTLQRQLYAFTVNCEGRIHYQSNKKARGYDGKIDILFDTGGGKLVNYEPSKHG